MANIDKPILVIVTAQGCRGCSNFKNSTRHALLQQLKAAGTVDIIEYDNPSVTPITSAPPNFHRDFGKWVEWFPCFLLFSGSSWKSQHQQLVGSIYAAVYQNGNLVRGTDGGILQDSTMHPTSDNIINWIRNEIASGKYNSPLAYSALPGSNVSYNAPNSYNGSNSSFGGNRALPAGYGTNRSNIKYGATVNNSASNFNNYGRGW